MRDPINSEKFSGCPDDRYAKAFAVSPDAIAVSDMETGCYLDVNTSFERLLGYKREEIIGHTSITLGIWADPNDRSRLMEGLRTQGSVENFLAVARRSDGGLRTCNLAGSVVETEGRLCVVLVVRDLTEQLATERALTKTAERYAKLFQSSPDAIAVTEMETGRLLEFNEGFQRIFGYERAMLSGKTTAELRLWADPRDREALVETLKEIGVIREAEFAMRRGDGRAMTILMSGEIIEFNGVMCLLSVVRDVTEQRQGERREAELKEQLQRVQKLEALGTLAGGVAHDFNNILTAILAYTEFTLMDPGDAESVQENLREVRKAALRARDLVKQILAFSRHQKLERVPIDLRVPVREALVLLRSSLPSTIEIEDSYPSEPVVVVADPGQIHQVVMNLGTNAAHAIKGNPGRLSVRIEPVRRTEVASAGYSGRGEGQQRVVISVADTGCGMDEDTLKRIFEPFFTTKGHGEGTGLGLSVVHGIVHAHGGSIEVHSALGKGSEFRVTLPLRDGMPAGGEARVDDMPRGTGERILVIDDEDSICELARRFLLRLGYRVSTYTNPVDALESFVADAPPFDLVLTDFTMPHLTGVDVARRVTERYPNLPVLMMSGYTGAWTQDRLKKVGVVHLINKPLTLMGLAEAVRDGLLGRHRLP